MHLWIYLIAPEKGRCQSGIARPFFVTLSPGNDTLKVNKLLKCIFFQRVNENLTSYSYTHFRIIILSDGLIHAGKDHVTRDHAGDQKENPKGC